MKSSILPVLVSVFIGIMLVGTACNSSAQLTGTYVVQYGDTLWDISQTHLENPYRWHEIHQNNPQIQNPHRIYPGDTLAVSPHGMATGEAGQQARPRRSNKAISRPWYGVPAPQPVPAKDVAVPGPIVPSADFIESNGYIVPYSIEQLQSESFAQITSVQMNDDEDQNLQIIHSEYGQPGLIYGDSIYLNKGTADHIHEGDVFVAFRPIREITHPLTSELIGTQIAILGRLRVKTLEPQIACAEIVKSYNYMEIGNPLLPASELSIPLTKPLVGNPQTYGLQVGNQLIGHIVAEKINRRGISYGDIVFLDVGAAQGVQPADNFIVYREIGKGFPKQAIGSVVVLSTQENTSTAMVTNSTKPIEIGEKIVLTR